jgi:hypothetical protein
MSLEKCPKCKKLYVPTYFFKDDVYGKVCTRCKNVLLRESIAL